MEMLDIMGNISLLIIIGIVMAVAGMADKIHLVALPAFLLCELLDFIFDFSLDDVFEHLWEEFKKLWNGH